MSQVDHAVDRLSQAGLGDSNNDSDDSSSNSNNNNTKWIIIGASVGGVVLIALLILAFILIRRWRKRRAYAMVSKGKDMAEAPRSQGMGGGLMPVRYTHA
jgi:flagellar biosynthesis/type III secretory pathway M-ring protein FliF/YscJ